MSKPTRTRRPIIEAIEPRLLFSATADIAVFDDGSHYVDALMHAANNLDLTQVYPDLMAQPPLGSTAVSEADTSDTPIALPTDTPLAVASHSLVFVDTHVDNYEALVKDILNNPDNKNVEIIYLDANQDGIAQISKTLSSLSNVSSIQLISHSVAGELQLGSSILSESTLAQFKNQLQTWQRALTNDADILIYGCNLAASTAGVNLLQDLSQLTGADIAASTNVTGNAAPNADWVLEKKIGHIETAALISAPQTQTWHGVLADVTYINTGSGGSNYALIPGDFAGQSFQIAGAATIDRFSVEINKTAGAAAQNLFLEIRDGYNGNVIGSATVSSSSLSNGVQWVNFDFAETSLTAYQVYWARLTTNGSDGLVAATYHNTDVFGTGTFFNNGGGAPWDLSFAVTNVAATNNAPSVTITPTTYSATEQVAMNLHGTGISIADVDGDNLTLTLAATSVNSQLTAAAGTTGVTINSGNGTNSLVLSGTVAQLNDFFNGNNSATLTYRIAANTPVASSTFTITANDSTLSANDSAVINITAVNDGPVNTKPGTQNITEDIPLVFSAGNGNQISIADVDAGSASVQTTVSVTNGALSLAGITGLSFTTGDGTSDASMTFTGTLTNINNALAALTYTPTSNFNGSSTLTITTNDLGNTGTGGPLSDTDTVTINVAAANDAPTTANPIPNQNAPKNLAFNFTFASNTFSDVDAATTLTYSAILNGGGALPSWLSFNPGTRTFSGTPTISDVGTLNIDVTANDGSGGTVTDTFSIITSANLDTNYIDTGSNGFELTVSTTRQIGQSFSYTSGNGTYLANEISLFTVAYGAAPQTVTLELLDAWNGTVLGTASVASTDLSQVSKEWHSFDFGNVLLTDGTTYYIKVSSTGTDNAIKLGHFGDIISGNVLDNGVDDLTKDLVFKMSYENGSNIAPAVDNPIADKALNTEATFSFNMPSNVFSDADPLDTLTYRAHLVGQSGLNWITFDTATLHFGGTPHFNQIGTWQVEVVATDNHGASTSEFFDVVVSNANTVPTPIPDQNVLEGSPYNFQFTAFDNANGHPLTYTATQANGNPLPAWLNFNPTTRTFSGTADDGDVNVKTIEVTASDGFGGSVSDTFVLTVTNQQEAPYILNPILDQNATGYLPFSFSFNSNVAGDPDIGDTLTYSAHLSGGGALPSWLSYNASTRTFSGTPTNADVGTLVIDVIATDTGSNTATDTFNLVIAAGNTPPVNTVPGAQITNEDLPLVFKAGYGNQIQITDVDAGSNSVQVNLGVTHGGLSLAGITGLSFLTGDGSNDASMSFTGTVIDINAALATLTYTSTANYFGTDTLNITTNDLGNTGVGGAHSDSDSVSLTVLSVNDVPTVANAIADQNATEDSIFNFQFASNTFSDVDVGDTFTYTATLNGGGVLPSWLSFNAATRTFSGTPTNADVGTLTIDVTANDGHGGNGTDTFAIIIANTNDAPTIANAIPDQNAAADFVFNFQFASNTFNDVDATDTLTYTTQLNGGGALPSWLSFNASTRTFSGTPTNADIGTLTIDVTASDGNGGTVTDTFALVIANTNDAPTIANAIPDQNATEDSAFNFQFAPNTFNDVDVGDTLTYSSTLNGGSVLPSWLNFNAATRTFSGTPTNADVGTLTIDVAASDGNGGTVTDTFSLVIANTNDAPAVANAIPDQNATEDSAFNFQFPSNTFNDADATDTLTYSSQLNGGGTLPSWLSFNAATRTFSGTPTNAEVGTLTIDVTANDGNGGTVTDTFALVIANTNDAPTVANTIPNQNATEDSAFNFQFTSNTFNDADATDTLTYTTQLNGGGTLPSWLSFNAATRTFSGAPTNADVGTLTIDVTANDGNGGTVTDTFSLVIANTNDAPTVANAIPDQNATEDSAFNFQFSPNTFNDVDVGDSLTYTSTLNGGSALPSWLSFNATTRTFSGTPNNADVGTLTINVTASDGNGGTVTDTFALVIANTNDAPTIANAIPDQNATEDSAFNFQFASNTFNDADVGDTLTYSSTLNGGSALPSWLSFNASTRTFSGTPTNADVGTLTIDVTASDGNGGTVTNTFALVIANTNDAPTVANAIPDQNATEDSAFNFQFASNTFNDADVGDSLTYTSTLNGGGALPSWLSFNAATRTFSGTPTNADIGTLTIDVTASDGNGGTVTVTFALVIANTNDAPTVANAIPDQNATEDSAFNFQFAPNTFNDVDVGDTLTYSSTLNGGSALPSWLNFNAVTRTFSGTPTNTDVGTLTIDVTASDGNGGSVSDTFSLVIANTNDAPTVANAIPDQNATEDSAFNFQFPSNTFNDVDASDTLTYTSTLTSGGALPSWLTFNSATRTFSGTPTNTDVGTLTINVTANDGHGGIITDSFDLSIANTNDAPVIANAIPTQKATEDSAFNFQFATNTFNDMDVGDSLTYTTQINGGGALPAWLSFNSATRTFSGTPTATDIGTLAIDVIATDNYGQSVTTNFVLNVVNTNKAPTTTGIATLNTLENSTGDLVDLFSAFADREDQDAQLTYSIVNNTNNTLVTQTTIDAQTGKLQLHYGQNQFGTSQITVRATDSGGASVDTSFAVNVAFVNQMPTSLGIKNIAVIQNSAPTAIDLSNIFNDIEDGRNLQYSIINNSNPALLNTIQINQQNHTSNIIYNYDAIGETNITLRATDANGGFVDSTFKVTVIAQKPASPIDHTTDTPPIQNNNNGSNSSPLEPSKTIPGSDTSTNTPLGGGKNSEPASDAIDNTLSHNLIGNNAGGEAANIILPARVSEVDDSFDHNRYDRIVQQELITKKINDPLNSRTLISSLILPGEGFSSIDAAEFSAQLRKIHQEMENTIAEEQHQKALLSGLTLSVTTGILIWSLRASSLLLTLMSMLPLWRGIDPLPILEEVQKRKKDIEKQRDDKKAEDKNAKEVGYLFDTNKNPKDNG